MRHSRAAFDRVNALLDAARRVAEPQAAHAERVRQVLAESSGLSREGVELALCEALELTPSAADLEQLLAAVEPAPACHVLLSANVFTAPLRALALALAVSPRVRVRPSRREPAFTHFLHAQAPDLFEMVPELKPAPAEQVWAYGSDATLAKVRAALPKGVIFHGHGAGFGAVLLDPCVDLDAAAAAVARDLVFFDQRGCLSPRLTLLPADLATAEQFARALATALNAWQLRVPGGVLTPAETAAVTHFRQVMDYAGSVFPAGNGWVSVGAGLALAPTGRNMHVMACVAPHEALAEFCPMLTTLGVTEPERLQCAQRYPDKRVCRIGEMQTPALDGPVDRRTPRCGETL